MLGRGGPARRTLATVRCEDLDLTIRFSFPPTPEPRAACSISSICSLLFLLFSCTMKDGTSRNFDVSFPERDCFTCVLHILETLETTLETTVTGVS